MTTPTTSSRRGPLLAIAALVLVMAGAAGLWYLFLRPGGPPPVSLATLPPVTATDSQDAGSSPGASGAAATAATGDTSGAADGISGSWAVDTSIGSFSDFSSTFVGYRVREELASVGTTDAVGRTPVVSGLFRIDGTTVTAGEITADLTSLRSSESNRDRQLQRQALETSRFPTATFTLTQPVELGSMSAEGATVDLTLAGDLTLHGVTNAVQVPLQARLQGGVITVVGKLPIVFADYGIAKPQAMIVLSVEDNGTMEFQVHLTRA